mgnify:CR=1 FL=1
METQTQGLTNQEIQMFNEISKIFNKYKGSCREFGLFHVHDHFDISNNEVLYETNNPQERTHQVIVKNKNDVKNAKDHKSLLGIEGNYSRKYFQVYFKELGWRRRAPRVKEDIPNLLLDIGYTYLFNFVDAVLRVYGFDTYKGVYHKLFFARKSLACDLMEPFRPIIDRKLRAAWNLGQIKKEDFKYWNRRYQLPWQVSNTYSKLFFETIMDEKEEIFLYIRDYYRYIMNPDENEFPIIDKKSS